MCSAELGMKKFITSGLVLTISEQVGSKLINPLFFQIRSNTLRHVRIQGQLSFAILLQVIEHATCIFHS